MLTDIKRMERIDMIGIDDPFVWSAYVLCIISAIGCMVYGLLKWNEEDEEELE